VTVSSFEISFPFLFFLFSFFFRFFPFGFLQLLDDRWWKMTQIMLLLKPSSFGRRLLLAVLRMVAALLVQFAGVR
jgi:hypothetical protein